MPVLGVQFHVEGGFGERLDEPLHGHAIVILNHKARENGLTLKSEELRFLTGLFKVFKEIVKFQ